MGKAVIVIFELDVGFIGGAMLGGSLIGDAATGAQIATDMSARIFSTVQAVQ